MLWFSWSWCLDTDKVLPRWIESRLGHGYVDVICHITTLCNKKHSKQHLNFFLKNLVQKLALFASQSMHLIWPLFKNMRYITCCDIPSRYYTSPFFGLMAKFGPSVPAVCSIFLAVRFLFIRPSRLGLMG